MSKPSLQPLVDLISRLRAPDGCPWDREQTLETVRAYLIEEAHEAAAAIDSGDLDELAGELGDVLFQWVFTARLAEEGGGASITAIIDRIRSKMIERHPHVFGDQEYQNADEVQRAWQRRKAEALDENESLLAGVPTSMPALLAAYRMTQKAAGVGFDWPDVAGVLEKVREELGEVEDELDRSNNRTAMAAELGDLLFAIANLCRHLDIDPEGALALTNSKFRRRFAHIERSMAEQDRDLAKASLAELQTHWEDAKAREDSS